MLTSIGQGVQFGKQILKNGSVFEGTIVNGALKHGKLNLPNGVIYLGEFEDNKFHGKGRMLLPDGREFTSVWNKNVMGPVGMIIYPNGEVYEGEIHDLKKEGKGTLLIQKDLKYVGEFK